MVPEQADDRERLAGLLSRFGAETAARPWRARGAARRGRRATRSDPCARPGELRAAEINLHQPTLDDVFLAKTGRKLEGSDDE